MSERRRKKLHHPPQKLKRLINKGTKWEAWNAYERRGPYIPDQPDDK